MLLMVRNLLYFLILVLGAENSFLYGLLAVVLLVLLDYLLLLIILLKLSIELNKVTVVIVGTYNCRTHFNYIHFYKNHFIPHHTGTNC